MANRFWVGGNDNWNATASSKWATTSGGAGGAAVPTTADDVFFDMGTGTGNVTIPTATTVSARSINFVDGAGGAYTNTFTHASSSANITLGDGTAGASSVALKYSSGMTLTLTGVGTITLSSTSATTQTITSNGKTLPNLVVNGAGSKYQFADNTTLSLLTYTAGAQLDLNSKTITPSTVTITGNSNTRELIFGTGILNCTTFGATPFTANGATNVTITASVGAQINTTAGNSPTMNLGSLTYTNVAVSHGTNAGNPTFTSSGATVYSLSRTGTAAKTDGLQFTSGGSITVTNGTSFNGNSSTNRLLVFASTPGSTFTITNNGTDTSTNVDFMDITGAGSYGWNLASITGLSGDAGGNSGITFTTAATQTYDGTAGNWSTAARWTSRVPLPQDNVAFATSSAAVSADMPRLGKDVNYTNYSGTVTYPTGLSQSHFGSVTLVSGMTFSMGNTVNFTMAGRGSHTFTSAGKTLAFTNGGPVFQAPGGTYTLQDAFNTSNSLNINDGTFATGNFSVTCSTFVSNTGRTRILTLGTSTITLTATGAVTVLSAATSTGLTVTSTAHTFTISNTSASTRTITLGTTGLAWGAITYTVAGSTGQLTLTSSTTVAAYIETLNFSDVTNARTLAITNGNYIVVNTLNTQGTSGKLMTVRGASAVAYLGLMDAVDTVDYLSVQDIFATIPYKFYAGANSTDVSGNTNVIFTAPVAGPVVYKQAENNATTTSLTATLPFSKTVSAGSLIYATYHANANPGTVTTPSGYTLIDSTIQGTTAYLYRYYKIAAGGETAVTFDTSNSVAGVAKMLTVAGFTGTPTLDVSDENSTAGATSLSTGSGVTNTDNPAIALAAWSAASSMGATVSFSNSFGEHRDSTQQNNARWGVKLLTSNASVTTTNTWTTSRAAVAGLDVFKSGSAAPSATGNFFLMF